MSPANTKALRGHRTPNNRPSEPALQPRIVLKFGSSVLQNPEDVPTAVHEIYRFVREGYRVLAVVSALGSTTDELLQGAQPVLGSPPAGPARTTLASLLATGELRSTALLALGLAKAGLPSFRLDNQSTWIQTSGDPLDATPIGLDANGIDELLKEHTVVILPGFVGVDTSGHTTVLGRGGSDLSALYAAWQLGAERCRLLKDVGGVYSTDPKKTRARRFETLCLQDAVAKEAQVLQPKALAFAHQHDQSFEVGAPLLQGGTCVGVEASTTAAIESGPQILRVALLGHGVVGGGVAQRLEALPHRFEVVGIGVQDVEKHAQPDRPGLFSDDWREVLAAQPDVVIECIGGLKEASEVITTALQQGAHVITANKRVIAEQGECLRGLAQQQGVSLRYGAAVGGVAPLLERVDHIAETTPIVSLRGVINGTCNDVLDRVGQGASFAEAILAAQEAGYAEADPARDLDGVDAAEKLAILIHHAFGQTVPVGDISCEGIANLDEHAIRRAHRSGRRFRLVAAAERTALGIRAFVRPVILPKTHALSQVHGPENRLLVDTFNGETCRVDGEGAGRWPTTEAILGDLLALANLQETIDCDDQEGTP